MSMINARKSEINSMKKKFLEKNVDNEKIYKRHFLS